MLCPTAAAACLIGISRGFGAIPSFWSPTVIAPELTKIISFPCFRSSKTWDAMLYINVGSILQFSFVSAQLFFVIEDVPILMTILFTSVRNCFLSTTHKAS
jgi:hypothetical protein